MMIVEGAAGSITRSLLVRDHTIPRGTRSSDQLARLRVDRFPTTMASLSIVSVGSKMQEGPRTSTSTGRGIAGFLRARNRS